MPHQIKRAFHTCASLDSSLPSVNMPVLVDCERAGLMLPRSTLAQWIGAADCHRALNWLFAGSLRAGQRAAAVMVLFTVQSPRAATPTYQRDVAKRLSLAPGRPR